MTTAASASTKLLSRLLADEVIPASQIASSANQAISSLLASKAIEYTNVGRGRSLRCVKPAIVAAYADQNFPGWRRNGLVDDSGRRAAGLTLARNTKTLRGLEYELVHVRCFERLAISLNGSALDLTGVTNTIGCASLVLKASQNDPMISGRVALVEGPDLFMKMNWATHGVDCVVYYAGRASERMIAWLASYRSSISMVMHFPDYDPVGMDEWLRIRARLGELKSMLYIPDNIDELFAKWSNESLLLKSNALMPKLIAADNPQANRIIRLMQRHNAGLEHEALLIG